MRILHIIESLNPAAGGPATVIARLAAAQAALGHLVTICSYRDAEEIPAIEKNLSTVPGIARVGLEYFQARSRLDWALVLSARPRIRELVRNTTVLHVHGVWEPLLRVASQYATRYRVPYVVRPAGMLDPWSLRQRWFKKYMAMWFGGYRKMFHNCAFMHTLNRDEQGLIGRLHLRCPLEVIPNGVFLGEVDNLPALGTFYERHPELQGKPYVLFLSRLHYKKGLDYLADAFALAAQERPNLHLVVAGPDGGARAEFLQRVERSGVQGRVHVVGPLYGIEKYAALVDAAMFCLPSRQEGFSLAITEALAVGLPAIISTECHFPEVAKAGAGAVVELEPRKIAQRLIEIDANPKLRAAMSQAGRALVRQHYTWPKIAAQTLAGYEQAFERRPPAYTVADPKQMRIVHVISSLAVEAGGPPVVCAGIAGAQAAQGHRVVIATTALPGQQRVSVPAGVEVLEFPIVGVERYASSPALEAWLNKEVPAADFLHLHSVWQFPTFAAARACWRAHKPYVVLLNGMLDTYSVTHRHYSLKRLYWLARERGVLGRAQALHCLNGAEIRRAVDWIGAMPKFICGNGISEAQFARMPARGAFRAAHPEIGARPLALFMSRVHPKKGLDRLLPAWRGVVERHPEARLAIAGTGEESYLQQIDGLIAQHGLRQQVIRVGQLAGVAKWEALVDADVFVLPSHQEGFSMAITESLAAGVPAVATVESNFDQLTTLDCGVEIAGGDMGAFASAVADLLADPERRARQGGHGRALVRGRFTWEGVAADLQRVYRWILQGRPLPTDGADVWRPGQEVVPTPSSAGEEMQNGEW